MPAIKMLPQAAAHASALGPTPKEPRCSVPGDKEQFYFAICPVALLAQPNQCLSMVT
ncbi:MAG: hypothetical protein P4L92_14415 [Rudaea sp.]|nr:hypothetical protein [Rudaea sp.]